jgi:eukaryotic-like serine/threonine-protein kinase
VRTEAGILKGKVAYMAPELVAGDPLDGRADLYAVGVMLWEATARRDRWPGMNDMAILAQLSRGKAPEPPDAVAQGLPALADAICLRALEVEPGQRYQSAAEMRADVQRLCDELGGRLGQAQIKDYMAQRFAVERRREEREIDEALHQEEGRPARDSEPPAFGSTKRVARKTVAKRDRSSLVPRPHVKGRGVLWVGLAVALLTGAVVARLLQPSSEPRQAAAGKSEAPALSTASNAAASASTNDESTPLPASAPSAVSSSTSRDKPRKPLRASSGAKPAPAASPTEPRLKLDRQDPWKE